MKIFVEKQVSAASEAGEQITAGRYEYVEEIFFEPNAESGQKGSFARGSGLSDQIIARQLQRV